MFGVKIPVKYIDLERIFFQMRWKRSQDSVVSLIFVLYEKDVIFYL